jgi:hypothetical protein
VLKYVIYRFLNIFVIDGIFITLLRPLWKEEKLLWKNLRSSLPDQTFCGWSGHDSRSKGYYINKKKNVVFHNKSKILYLSLVSVS